MEDDSRDPEQEQLIPPLTLCGGCPVQYNAESSPGVCLTPWLDMIETGALSKEAGQEAISRLLNRH